MKENNDKTNDNKNIEIRQVNKPIQNDKKQKNLSSKLKENLLRRKKQKDS